MKPKGWENQLNYLFGLQQQIDSGLAKMGGDYPKPGDQAISLVKAELQKQKEELVEMIKGMKIEIHFNGLIPTSEEDINIGYNTALDDILKKLEEV